MRQFFVMRIVPARTSFPSRNVGLSSEMMLYTSGFTSSAWIAHYINSELPESSTTPSSAQTPTSGASVPGGSAMTGQGSAPWVLTAMYGPSPCLRMR